jgi:hypothetical protein
VGLHIYFCDICGVRVTDVDLRSGHGLVRGHQVMCGTCVGMGHGQAWLQAAPAPQGTAQGSHPVIDAARDRAQTVADPLLPGTPRQDTHDTVRVPSVSNPSDLASVAQSLGAMQTPPKSSSDTVDDVEEVMEASRDLGEHPAAPFTPPTDADESSALQPAVKPPGSSSSRQVAATSKRGGDSKPRSSASNKPPSSRQTKAKTTKSIKGPTPSRRIPLPILVSVIGVLLIGIGTMTFIRHRDSAASKTGQVIELKDARDALADSIQTARKAMNAALESHTLPDLKQAQTKFHAAQAKVEEFSKQAQMANWTEENVEVLLEELRMADLQTKYVAILQGLARQGTH